MHRKLILKKLENYKGATPREEADRIHCINYIRHHKNCFDSTHFPVNNIGPSQREGHITASAWLLNIDRNKALFTHHRKLNKWIQLGGHCDGKSDVLKSALREAQEESGIDSLTPVSQEIFDLEVLTVPARRNAASHIHYDIRFLFQGLKTEAFSISAESYDLKWMTLREILNKNSEESFLRMCKKWQELRKK